MTDLPLNIIGTWRRVLKDGWISFEDMMPNPLIGHKGDTTIVNAARTSYLGESKGDEKDKALLFYLMQNKHTTPFEMVEFRFRVYLPLFTLSQWVRHRTWSYNVQSFRYSKPEIDFYHPEEWREQDVVDKQSSKGKISVDDQEAICRSFWEDEWDDARYHIKGGFGTLQSHMEELGVAIYNKLVESGVAREQARFFIPQNVFTTMVAKVDAYNLMHFLKLRMHPHAQWEIRQYALTIYRECFKPLLPWTAEAFEKFMLDDETKKGL